MLTIEPLLPEKQAPEPIVEPKSILETGETELDFGERTDYGSWRTPDNFYFQLDEGSFVEILSLIVES
jgi:hypothetical protein